MNWNGSFLLLSHRQKLVYNLIWGSSSIEEVQVQMFYSILGKFWFVVLGFVETHNKWHAHLFENRDVIFRSEGSVLVSDIQWAWESDKFSRHNPVQITVLNLFIVLVLLDIERFIWIPTEGDGKLKTLEAVVVSTFVGTSTHSSIPVWQELIMVRLKCLPCLLSTLLEHDDHVCSHEEGGIGLFCVVETGIVIDFVVGVVAIIHKLL